MKENEIRNSDTLEKYLEILKQDTDALFDKKSFVNIACPACGSKSVNEDINVLGFQYSECADCRTIYVNPRPTLEDLGKFYSNSDATNYWVNSFFMPMAEARREKIFKPRAKEIADSFPALCHGKIGDIGAGFGLFLEELKKIWINADIIAIEPSEEMSEICKNKGITVISKMVENVDVQTEGNFDLLTSFELFEHLYDPKAFLNQVRNLLKKDGYLVFTTLNGDGFDIRLLWEKSKSFSPPQHLNFFNPNSIRIVLEECGFITEQITTPGRLDWDIVEGNYHKNHIELDRFWKLVADCDDKVKENLQQWISENGLSSHMRVVARRK